jgi:hypothetical protein
MDNITPFYDAIFIALPASLVLVIGATWWVFSK